MTKLFYVLPLIVCLAFGFSSDGFAKAKKGKGGKKGGKKGKGTEMTFTGTVAKKKAAADGAAAEEGKKKKKKGGAAFVLTTEDGKEITLPGAIRTKDENGEKKTIKMKDFVDKKVTVTAKATDSDGTVTIVKLLKVEEAAE